MKAIPIFFIRIYQWTVRPLVGRNCKFLPTCSDYAIESFQKHGILRGIWLTACRLGKCNPWHPGGCDDVPL